MDTRRLQQVSGGTFTISLPRGWVENHGLEAGEHVNLHRRVDGTLTLEPGTHESPASGQVLLDVRTPPQAERALRAAYAAGMSTIRVSLGETAEKSTHGTLEAVTRNLTGLTVTERVDNEATLRTLLDSEEVSIEQSIHQLKFVALSMQEDAVTALADAPHTEGLVDRDDHADRLYALIERYFQKSLSHMETLDTLGLDRPVLFDLRTTGRELERVADHAERIGNIAADFDHSLEEETIACLSDLAARAREVVVTAVPVALGDGGMDDARQALHRREAVRESANSLDRKLFNREGTDYRLVRVLDSLRRTAELGGNIAEVGFRAAIRREGQSNIPGLDDPPDRLSADSNEGQPD